MAELPPELGPAQAPVTQGQQSSTPIADQMQQTVQDPTGDFLTMLIRLLESKGLDLDEIMGDETTPETDADLASGNIDINELLSEEELLMIAEKFIALNPEQQQQLKQEVFSQLPPKLVRRLEAVERFARQRMG